MTDEKKPTSPEEFLASTKRKRGRPAGSKNKNYEFKKDKIDREKAVKQLWNRGILKWKLDSNQQDLYNMYHDPNSDKLVVLWSRQIGKSYTVMNIISEELMKHDDWVIGYVAPKKSQAKKITYESISDIYRDAPDALRPKYNSIDSYWQFPKGGRLYIAGTDNGNIDNMRGSTFNRVFIDEFCFLDDFDYCLKSVIMPTLSSKDDTKIVMISSPPKTYDHPSNNWIDEAEGDGTLIERTLYDCPRYDEAKIEKIIKLNGPKDSIDFQREYLVKRIPDIRSLVLPECTPDKMDEIVFSEYQDPQFYNACVAADWGVMDSNFIIFAYYDFNNAKIVIDAELEVSGTNETSSGIAEKIKQKEKEIWKEEIPRFRYCDINLQLINDLNMQYDLQFMTTPKDNLQAAINNVRSRVLNGDIIIKARCKKLISQMKSASWDKTRKKFKRANGHHYDGVAALVYLVRNIDDRTNPFPPGYDIPDGMFMSPKFFRKKEQEGHHKLSEMLNMHRKKRRR